MSKMKSLIAAFAAALCASSAWATDAVRVPVVNLTMEQVYSVKTGWTIDAQNGSSVGQSERTLADGTTSKYMYL